MLLFPLKMSDSDSDSDLIQEVYDPEDNLNVYGSPVLRSAATEVPSTSSALTHALPERTQVRLACHVNLQRLLEHVAIVP